MTKRTKKHRQQDSSHEEAMRIALGIQRPEQTKEQTKLISQGIQKGIEQYKKQQNAKGRDLDKRHKKAKQQPASVEDHKIDVHESVVYRQHWLPWALLVLSWLSMAAYWLIE